MATISASTGTPTRRRKPSGRQKSLANRILAGLLSLHGGNVNIPELRLSSGFANESRIDLWSIDPSPATGNVATAYEIKISRDDWKRDNAIKQRGARLFADRFYYVTPPGLLKPEEIPDWAGLIEVDPDEKDAWDNLVRCKTIVTAPKLDKAHPTWGLVVSMLRRVPMEV